MINRGKQGVKDFHSPKAKAKEPRERNLLPLGGSKKPGIFKMPGF